MEKIATTSFYNGSVLEQGRNWGKLNPLNNSQDTKWAITNRNTALLEF